MSCFKKTTRSPAHVCVLLILVLTVIGSVQGSCNAACNKLRQQLPDSYVTTSGKSDRYWAKQIEEIQPACFVRPHLEKQVSTILKTVQQEQCTFAIRGGGHSDVPGASNLANGVTIDLGEFTDVKVSKNRKVASVGAGLDWGSIYKTLDPQDLYVVGGRESSVGAAGLTLGGGISYFSYLHGFACDNVKNYQVILANGDIVDANDTSKHKDLYRALRGGGNNFGVVTRFDLDAYDYHLMEGGLNIYTDSPATTKAQVDAFIKFAHNSPSDPRAALFTSLDHVAPGTFQFINGYYYSEPKPTSKLKIFSPYYVKQLKKARLASTERSGKHHSFAAELGATQPAGKRQQFHTATFKANATLMTKMFEIYREETKKLEQINLKRGVHLFSTNFAFQPISKNLLEGQLKRGGNVLGLDVSEAPLMLLSMSWPWSRAEDDELLIGTMDRVVQRSVDVAKKMGLFNKYIYMNYATPNEPVIASYGKANEDFLHTVSAKYDPKGVFQKLVPGGYKLNP